MMRALIAKVIGDARLLLAAASRSDVFLPLAVRLGDEHGKAAGLQRVFNERAAETLGASVGCAVQRSGDAGRADRGSCMCIRSCYSAR